MIVDNTSWGEKDGGGFMFERAADGSYLLANVAGLASKQGILPNPSLFTVTDPQAANQFLQRNAFVDRQRDILRQRKLLGAAGGGVGGGVGGGGVGGVAAVAAAMTDGRFDSVVNSLATRNVKQVVEQTFVACMGLFGLLIVYKILKPSVSCSCIAPPRSR